MSDNYSRHVIRNPDLPVPPPIVGLCGGIGAGKDVTTEFLIEDFGYRRVFFAEKLKEMCCDLFVPLGAERRHFFGTQDDKAEPILALGCRTGRHIMEAMGTEGGRAAYPDVWIRHALEHHGHGPNAIIVTSDVRFPNEVDAIKDAGGVIFRLGRSNEEAPSTGHSSDEFWRKWTVGHELDGDFTAPFGQLPALFAQVGQAVMDLSRRPE